MFMQLTVLVINFWLPRYSLTWLDPGPYFLLVAFINFSIATAVNAEKSKKHFRNYTANCSWWLSGNHKLICWTDQNHQIIIIWWMCNTVPHISIATIYGITLSFSPYTATNSISAIPLGTCEKVIACPFVSVKIDVSYKDGKKVLWGIPPSPPTVHNSTQ